METKKEYFLEILPNNHIQVLIQTIYYRPDGSELTRDNWRTILEYLDNKSANEILDERSLAIVNAVWGAVQ